MNSFIIDTTQLEISNCKDRSKLCNNFKCSKCYYKSFASHPKCTNFYIKNNNAICS